ncbi:ABC transporter ATP-binding protein [Chitinimonas sp. PSY-7]|uniref:ATP-binding cassette domain-containing protein n=1 Tax=Chitinimonas sp. PSY-7 TaxID=3459088 RepID=UPI0040401557
MMSQAIFLENIEKYYRNSRFKSSQVLHGISFSVAEGEAFGFIGQNGAGKSSTIKILVGVSKPSAGLAQLHGLSVDDFRARQGLAYVPENPSLYDYLTPLEILEMGVHMHRVVVPDVRKHCLEWLSRFRIDHVATKRIRQFSKGMVQRTALAHALACKPRLLILDEPLSGLDPVGRKETVDCLQEYHRTGGTLFFSSHVLHDVERLADKYALIHQGVLRTVQSREALLGMNGRLAIRTYGEAFVEGMSRQSGNDWYGEVEPNALWPFLNMLQQAGHQVIEVKSLFSLEQVFLQYIQAS